MGIKPRQALLSGLCRRWAAGRCLEAAKVAGVWDLGQRPPPSISAAVMLAASQEHSRAGAPNQRTRLAKGSMTFNTPFLPILLCCDRLSFASALGRWVSHNAKHGRCTSPCWSVRAHRRTFNYPAGSTSGPRVASSPSQTRGGGRRPRREAIVCNAPKSNIIRGTPLASGVRTRLCHARPVRA